MTVIGTILRHTKMVILRLDKLANCIKMIGIGVCLIFYKKIENMKYLIIPFFFFAIL